MAKNTTSFYDKLLEKRKSIMLVIIFVLTPLLFMIGLLTVTYTNNKPNPFADVEYTKTTIEELNDTKFEIEKFYLSTFALFLEDEVFTNAEIELAVDLGKRVDSSLSSSEAITVEYYLCYNWTNYTSKTKKTISANINMTSTGKSSLVFDATEINRNPFFFKSIDLQKDARILTMFSWYETIDGESQKVNYLVESSFNDLYISKTDSPDYYTELQK